MRGDRLRSSQPKASAGRALLAGAGCCFALALGASPALALQTHVFSSSFGSQGSGAGEVSSPQAVAVNSTTGNVYLADTGNARVDEFDSSGTFVRAWGWGVSDGASSFETCTTACQAGISGSGAGQFTTPAFVAVDNSAGASAGDVYVGDPGDDVVTKFTAAGALVSGWATGGQLNGSTATSGPFGPLAGITVDTTGNLWVYNQSGEMFEFGQDASFTQDWNSGRGVTADGIDADSAGNLYVLTGGGTIEQFSSTGTDVGPVNGDVSSPTGFAVDRSGDDVYMDNGGTLIYHYPASCDAGGTCTAVDKFGSGDLSSAAGLAVDTANATVYAADAGDQRIDVFTPATLPDVTTGQASSVTPTGATLNGTVNPDATTITDCHFDYVDDADYNPSAPNPYSAGDTAPCSTTPSGSSPVSASAGVSSLQPSTTYHFRLQSTNSGGTSDGSDQTFTTQGPPAIDGESATPAGITSEALSAQINPNGLDTTYHFEYGTAGSCSSSPCTSIPVPDADIGSQTTDQTVSQTITGLNPGTTYHYRVVATNSAGPPVDGADQTFTTAPPFGLTPSSFTAGAFNDDGAQPFGAGATTDTQAGDHPYQATTSFTLNTTTNSNGSTVPSGGDAKDIIVDLPPGFVGDPNATPYCQQAVLTQTGACSNDTVVGMLELNYSDLVQGGVGYDQYFPVYNMAPSGDEVALFAFHISQPSLTILIHVGVRTTGDYGLVATIPDISQAGSPLSSTLTLWGVPADPSHDPYRGSCLDNQSGGSDGSCPSDAPEVPFLTNPALCNGQPLTSTIHVDSWQDPGSYNADGSPNLADPAWHTATSTSPAPTGCSALSFDPSLSAVPTSTAFDSPTGLDVDIHVPQDNQPQGLGAPALSSAVVTLPAGVVISPSSANDLDGCTPDQIGIGSNDPVACPDASKLATVRITSPDLPESSTSGEGALTGFAYLGKPASGPITAPPYVIYLNVTGYGLNVKLTGQVVPNPVTGQLTTTFADNPPLPFDDLQLDFFSGPLAPLATPAGCGTYTTTSQLTPFSSQVAATSSSSFTTSFDGNGASCPDPQPFAPTFTAGTANAQAGAYTPFTLSFSRTDQDQELSGLSVTLPPGLVAKLAGVPLCSDADANAGTCPAGSQVGTATAGAGPGPDPFFLPGTAYLTGPYKGAPYGLVVEVPAIAGPFDLGTVVVRQQLLVDPTTAQVTAVSDPFPTILQGIPLQIRRIDVEMNRPGFIVNPTSCDPMAITGTLSSVQGASAAVSSRFQVGGCQELGFSPKLSMALTGKGKTKSGDHPALVSTLTQPFGQANIHNVRVTLPLSIALDPNNSQHVCNYLTALAVHGGAVGCPASTIVGTASAITPLLSQPLTGNVYLVQGIRFNKQNQPIRTLPSLLIPLRGQIALDLRAQTSVSGASQLVTTFSTIPDAAVSKFTLTITGGKKGLLVITGRGRTICNKHQITGATLGAQSGKTENSSIKMSTPCVRPETKHSKKHRATPKHKHDHK